MQVNAPARVIQVVAACLLSVCASIAMPDAASVATVPGTTIESLGTITAEQVSNGLGFVVPQDNQDWQFAAAAAAGATHVRFQCAWNNTEKQPPPPNNTSQGFSEDPNCVLGFASTLKYGLKATVVAAYGPPYHKILNVTMPSGASVGSTSITVQFASGVGGDTPRNLASPYDYILGADGSMLTGVHNYAGSFITGVSNIDATHATVSLSSALTQSLPANTTTQYVINEILYPSAASFSADDPSVIAYSNYVSWLATDMAARGVTGEIEIWNEPPWVDDAWDNRGDLYDTFPATGSIRAPVGNGPNFGFAANLQKRSLPKGITLVWAGTNKSGQNSLLLPGLLAATGSTLIQPVATITSESFHPYGNTPEEMMWSPSCLQASVHANSSPDAYQNCYLSGEKTGPNFLWAMQYALQAQTANRAYGLAHSITETGTAPPIAGLRASQAKFVMRQFVGFQAEGVTPIEFYSISDSTMNDPSYGFVGYSGTGNYTEYPAYAAISGFMADVKRISNLPVAKYSDGTLASLNSYSGTYPLSYVHIIGSRSAAAANSDLLVVWQRSYTPGCGGNGAANASSCDSPWILQPPPPPGSATITIPAQMQLTSMVNADTRASVAHTFSGQQVSFNVSDDPIEILLDPTPDAVPSSSRPQPPTNVTISVQ
ncbi:MAG TPA: hypothetical protein VFE02_18565 [Candidatus Acidoferrales bacterium]|jgi:hypothetical protein|nr:hypothetical protein [Candidatus Acidoferrales bacterium]